MSVPYVSLLQLSCVYFGLFNIHRARLAINPIQSARITTAGRFTIKYGRVEVVAKLPVGDWLWPAIWLLPEASLVSNDGA